MINQLRIILNFEVNEYCYNQGRIKSFGNPIVYQIELTNDCPMRCIMCPRTERMTREVGYMNENLFKKIIKQTAQYSSRIFLHHFGESLLHPKLGEFISYAKKHKIKTYLSANPSLLTEKRSKQLVDNGLNELVLSLDAVNNSTNAAIRGKAVENFELAEKNILKLLDYRKRVKSKYPKIILQIIKQKNNIEEIPIWIEKWKANKDIDRLKIKSYITWDGQDESINSLQVETLNVNNQIVCDKPWTSVTVLWDGRIVPCCFDYDGLYVLGDLSKQTVNDIWNNEKMQYLRSCHNNKEQYKLRLCGKCIDYEGYSVKKWYYPLNRLLFKNNRLGDEHSIGNVIEYETTNINYKR
jgi:radical SAM protein with 4Fe4S-binding SPASM domain